MHSKIKVSDVKNSHVSVLNNNRTYLFVYLSNVYIKSEKTNFNLSVHSVSIESTLLKRNMSKNNRQTCHRPRA